MSVRKALDTLESSLTSKEKLMEMEHEVKTALHEIGINARLGDKDAQDIIAKIVEVTEKSKKPKCSNTQVSK